MPDIAIQFSAACRVCNPDDPIFYDDQAERDHEAQEHANKTGHKLDVGFCVK